jgi:inorganic pyrophosphatase
MANLNIPFQKYMVNPIHVVPAYANKEEGIINMIVEINKGTLTKYEIINETGMLKVDRVGYSSLAFPFTYGGIPMTWDEDGDPLDIELVSTTEPLVPGSLIEARVLGVMKFIDGDEVDDKIIAVPNDDKRLGHLNDIKDLPEYFITETKYYWEKYKELKKPGTGEVKGFFDKAEALKIIDECVERYEKEIKPQVK